MSKSYKPSKSYKLRKSHKLRKTRKTHKPSKSYKPRKTHKSHKLKTRKSHKIMVGGEDMFSPGEYQRISNIFTPNLTMRQLKHLENVIKINNYQFNSFNEFFGTISADEGKKWVLDNIPIPGYFFPYASLAKAEKEHTRTVSSISAMPGDLKQKIIDQTKIAFPEAYPNGTTDATIINNLTNGANGRLFVYFNEEYVSDLNPIVDHYAGHFTISYMKGQDIFGPDNIVLKSIWGKELMDYNITLISNLVISNDKRGNKYCKQMLENFIEHAEGYDISSVQSLMLKVDRSNSFAFKCYKSVSRNGYKFKEIISTADRHTYMMLEKEEVVFVEGGEGLMANDIITSVAIIAHAETLPNAELVRLPPMFNQAWYYTLGNYTLDAVEMSHTKGDQLCKNYIEPVADPATTGLIYDMRLTAKTDGDSASVYKEWYEQIIGVYACVYNSRINKTRTVKIMDYQTMENYNIPLSTFVTHLTEFLTKLVESGQQIYFTERKLNLKLYVCRKFNCGGPSSDVPAQEERFTTDKSTALLHEGLAGMGLEGGFRTLPRNKNKNKNKNNKNNKRNKKGGEGEGKVEGKKNINNLFNPATEEELKHFLEVGQYPEHCKMKQ